MPALRNHINEKGFLLVKNGNSNEISNLGFDEKMPEGEENKKVLIV